MKAIKTITTYPLDLIRLACMKTVKKRKEKRTAYQWSLRLCANGHISVSSSDELIAAELSDRRLYQLQPSKWDDSICRWIHGESCPSIRLCLISRETHQLWTDKHLSLRKPQPFMFISPWLSVSAVNPILHHLATGNNLCLYICVWKAL